MMKVSALIPTYNRRNYIQRAIDSVLSQTVPVDEIVVVDDGSTDGTAEFVTSLYGDKVRLIKQQNTGVAGARRNGIQEARGEWIAFLDSDDEWMPDRNRQLLDAAAQVPEDVGWIFGDLLVMTDAGPGKTFYQEYGLSLRENPEIFADSLTVQFPFQFGMLQGSLIRRKALLELNCFTEGLRSDDDLLAGFQVACSYRFAAIPEVVGKYFRTSDLDASSVVVNGVFGKDYFRSRMIAFACVIESGRPKRPWNLLYASEVRGLCKVLAEKGDLPRSLAFQQFRYGGYSIKGLAFLFASVFGKKGIRMWVSTAGLRRKYLLSKSSATSGNPDPEIGGSDKALGATMGDKV